MDFEILHISDVHFVNESTSQKAVREEIIKKIQELKLGADCLIISGDLFHRGSLDKQAAQASKEFISKLKTSLKKQVDSEGQSRWVEPIILICPGNHDLDRDARKKKSEAYNIFTKRTDLVNKAGETLKKTNGEYRVSNNEETAILYQMAFEEFQRFSKEIGSEVFCSPDAQPTVENYEIQQRIFSLPENKGAIHLVFLNTALFAGQTVHYDGFRERKDNLEREYKQALEEGQTVASAQMFLKIAKLQESYEKDGGIVIDEESDARLGLSAGGNEYLRNIDSHSINPHKNTICTIFVGHHGVEFLSAETRKALESAMRSCKSGIYLCGHSHKVRYTEHQLEGIGDPKRIEQIQAGVMFADDEEYAQYGFTYIKFDIGQTEQMFRVSSYYFFKTPFGDQLWGGGKVFEHSLPTFHVEPQGDSLTGEMKIEPVPEENAVDPTVESNIPEDSGSEPKKPLRKARRRHLHDIIDIDLDN